MEARHMSILEIKDCMGKVYGLLFMINYHSHRTVATTKQHRSQHDNLLSQIKKKYHLTIHNNFMHMAFTIE